MDSRKNGHQAQAHRRRQRDHVDDGRAGGIIQRQLGVKGCGAFDVHAVCSGFVYGLDLANRYIQTGGARTALVIGSETLSRITNWEDRGTAVLFGDGAGAVVLQASEEPGILSTHIHADGEYEELLQVKQGVSVGFDVTKAGGAYITMEGNAVFRRAVATFDNIARETVADLDGHLDDIDWFIPHQANMRIIKAAAKKLQMPMERVIWTSPFVTVVSSGVRHCCWPPSGPASPGGQRCSAIESRAPRPRPIRHKLENRPFCATLV